MSASLSFRNGGSSKIQTGLFIGGEFRPALDGKTLDVIDPTTEKVICAVSCASDKDVDEAVKVARKAYETSWGHKVPGSERGRLLMKLADLIDAHTDELAAIESLDNGKAFAIAKSFDVPQAAANIRYMAGWADKVHGKVIEVEDGRFNYTRHEPIGVVGQIIPWNFPILMLAWKLGPALATGNTVVLKTAEQTPLSALKVCELIQQVGFPKGVVNIITGLGPVAGAAVSAHMDIDKVAFTGSTLVGRHVLKAAASSNLKKVTLELGGKSPNIVFADADIDQAVSWSVFGFTFNHGQCCCAGTRIYVEDSIYDEFMKKLDAKIKAVSVGDPFKEDTFQGPQVSQLQFDRIMAYIDAGKKEGGTIRHGGERHGKEGYFIQPTVFENVKPDAKIMQEEIFGPVVNVTRFKTQDELVKLANDSIYGLAASVFTRDISRAHEVAHQIRAGTVWVNNYNQLHAQTPFGGFKSSGIGRELGEYALANYCEIKAVNVNLSLPNPL